MTVIAPPPRGFTLLETIVAMTLVATMAVSLFHAHAATSRAEVRAHARIGERHAMATEFTRAILASSLGLVDRGQAVSDRRQ